MNNILCYVYQQVLDREICHANINSVAISDAINNIHKTYRRISKSHSASTINYNDFQNRYAYIYLYSICHTATVICQIKQLQVMSLEFFRIMKYNNQELKICSLGGGPGCDIIGLLIARSQGVGFVGNTKRIRCTVVDVCDGWRTTLHSVFMMYLTSYIGFFYQGIVCLEFVQADLCAAVLSESVVKTIRTSDVVSLVKFISVASHSYHRNPTLLQNVFNLMKESAYVIFLDNSNGGFCDIVSNAAQNAGLTPIILPVTSRCYVNTEAMMSNLSSSPLNSTSVSFAVWQNIKKRVSL